MSKEADVKAAVDKAVELFGRLDVMVSTSSFTAYAWLFVNDKFSSITQVRQIFDV